MEPGLHETKAQAEAGEADLGPAALIATVSGLILTTVVVARFLQVGPEWFSQAARPEDVVRRILIPEAFAGTVAMWIVLRLGWGRGCGFVAPPLRPGLLVGLLPLGFMVIAAIAIALRGFPGAQAWFVPTLLAAQLLVGFNEETVDRGILLYGFERLYGRRMALILSSVLFGLSYLVHLAFGDSLGATLHVVLAATILGFVLGVMRLRTGSIWFSVAMHGLWNFTLLGVYTIPVERAGSVKALQIVAAYGTLLVAGFLRLGERRTSRKRRQAPGGPSFAAQR